MYLFIFLVCVNTIKSMINTNPFFDLFDFQDGDAATTDDFAELTFTGSIQAVATVPPTMKSTLNMEGLWRNAFGNKHFAIGQLGCVFIVVVVVCCCGGGSLLWFIVVVHCGGSLLWFIVVVHCCGSLLWLFIVFHVVHCFPCCEPIHLSYSKLPKVHKD